MTLVDSTLSPLLEARAELASTIQAATGYACHASKPAALSSPCIILEPDGWQPFTASGAVIYRVRVTVLYASKDETDMANGVEELARLAYTAGVAAGWRAVEVPTPGSVTVRTDEFAGVQFQFTKPLEME